jgi:hypothetical protein
MHDPDEMEVGRLDVASGGVLRHAQDLIEAPISRRKVISVGRRWRGARGALAGCNDIRENLARLQHVDLVLVLPDIFEVGSVDVRVALLVSAGEPGRWSQPAEGVWKKGPWRRTRRECLSQGSESLPSSG